MIDLKCFAVFTYFIHKCHNFISYILNCECLYLLTETKHTSFFSSPLHQSSYQQPPNFCTEAVIDRVMKTCMLAH